MRATCTEEAGTRDGRDAPVMALLVHPGNTSRKNVHDAWWHPRPVEEIASLMGPEWAAHWAAEQVTEPARESQPC
jgi:hypothetical protein